MWINKIVDFCGKLIDKLVDRLIEIKKSLVAALNNCIQQ